VKANQAALLDAVTGIAATVAPADSAVSRNKGRARQEDRAVEIFPVGETLAGTECQPFINTLIRVLRSVAAGLWTERAELADYISSAVDLPAATWSAAIREHWPIENRNPYVRDVSCEEDGSRISNNPGIMARARSFALNILRKNGVTNVAQALWAGAIDLDHVLAYSAI
jgi:predicted transposase YbfD/YdcC